MRIPKSLGVVVLLAATAGAVPLCAQTPQTASDTAAVRLSDLIAEAERNHPAIQAAARMVDVKRARAGQAGALPDPQISAGYMGDIAPFKIQANDPSSYRQFGVMQEIPYPGKRKLQSQVALKDVDAEAWNVEAARRRIRAEVSMAFYELAAVDRALEITQRNKDLLEKLARIAEEKYKVGRGLQQDVFRAQLEVTRIVQRITVLQQRRNVLAAQLNSLLTRPSQTPIGALAAADQAEFAYSLDELTARAIENNPEMKKQDELAEQGRIAGLLAQKEFYPDFGVGWDYLNRTSGQPEMYGLKFTMTIPLNRGRRRAGLDEATAMQASARQMREAARTELIFRINEQYLQARASEQLLTLYKQGIVPQASLALESGLASYQSGALDFLSVISNFMSVLDYEVGYYEELANFNKSLARLEELTGMQFNSPRRISGERR